jgi:hypothetical protein
MEMVEKGRPLCARRLVLRQHMARPDAFSGFHHFKLRSIFTDILITSRYTKVDPTLISYDFLWHNQMHSQASPVARAGHRRSLLRDGGTVNGE